MIRLLFFLLPLVLMAQSTRWDGNFTLRPDDTVVTLGGSNAEAMRHLGYLETSLQLAFPEARARFRNMAWQADTVFRQQRPRNFGDLPSRLRELEADVIFLQFGRAEAIDGHSPGDFIKAYATFIDSLMPVTERLVLVLPFPFREQVNEHLPHLLRHNDRLKEYVDLTRALAKSRGFLTVDLFATFQSQADAEGRLTADGVRLTDEGQRRVAKAVVEALRLPWHENDELRADIVARNQLWHRYWRPTNWAFLRGNRTHVPSSRDHRNNSRRWFPAEIDALLPLIGKADGAIADSAKSQAKR